MRLVPVQQLQMERATRLICKGLEELPGQPESKGAGHILQSFVFRKALELQLVQTAPDQTGPTAEIYHTPRQTFIHRHEGFAREGIARVEAGSIPSNARLVPEGLAEGLPQGQAAILHRVMRVHAQVAHASKPEVHHRVPGEERQHVVEERNASFYGRLAATVEVEPKGDPGFLRLALQPRRALLHAAQLIRRGRVNKAQRPLDVEASMRRSDNTWTSE